MKLLTYRKGNGYGLGALVGQRVLDVNKALNTRLDMLKLLDRGEEVLGRVADAVKSAEDKSRANKGDGLLALKDLRLAAPIPRTRKNIVCLGLNYAEHVKEGGKDRDLPPHPIFFTKPPTAITGPYDPVVYGRAVDRLDYEVELAFVIGTEGKYISKDEALDHVAGYMVFQDISERTLQRQHQQWFRGKSLDTFAPMGPYLVTQDEVRDPQNLDIWSRQAAVQHQEHDLRRQDHHKHPLGRHHPGAWRRLRHWHPLRRGGLPPPRPPQGRGRGGVGRGEAGLHEERGRGREEPLTGPLFILKATVFERPEKWRPAAAPPRKRLYPLLLVWVIASRCWVKLIKPRSATEVPLRPEGRRRP
jgi:2-keto-4-pentenoate hydratase/2-oxohepta-3-ene-1,7-dioic acid hydratase in catechol pathway